MEADASSFTHGRIDPAAFAHWSKGFDLRADGPNRRPAEGEVDVEGAARGARAVGNGLWHLLDTLLLQPARAARARAEVGVAQAARREHAAGRQAGGARTVVVDFDDAFNDPPPRQVAQPSVVAVAGSSRVRSARRQTEGEAPRASETAAHTVCSAEAEADERGWRGLVRRRR